jgi:serine/threonine-protein kinase RsbW
MFSFNNTRIEKRLLVRSKLRMSERSLKIEGRFDQIAQLSDLVECSALEAGFDSRDRYALQLAVCEALENIIIHGYQGESCNLIETHLIADPGKVRIEIWDDAPPFNQAIGPAEIDWTEDDPPVGGLGLLIIHKVMDEIHYERKGMRNWLSMRKCLQPKKP